MAHHKGEDFNVQPTDASNHGPSENFLSQLRESTVIGAVDSKFFQPQEMTVINEQNAQFRSGNMNYTEEYAKLRAAKEAAVYEA